MKIFLETLGCKLNQAETEKFTWDLMASGYEVTSDITRADILILNTCTVTSTTDAKSRQRLRFVHKINPSAFKVVTGCYAERDPETLRNIPGVGLVIDNKNKVQLVPLLQDRVPLNDTADSHVVEMPTTLRTRAFIKVQEGCNGACAYCIVPKVRQGETSIPAREVMAQLKHREALGYKEIVLTGTRVGGYADNTTSIKELLELILDETKLPRIRLSSLQPQEISPSLLGLWKNGRLMPHFHMALQSGCDQILNMMRRRYSLQNFREAVKMIRDAVPDAAITTDIIVGFPGENASMFTESYHTCADIGFARIHVFPYSPRPATAATLFPGAVSESVKKERVQKMLELAAQCEDSFRAAFTGRKRQVLWENQDSKGFWNGWTDNYIPVKIKGTGLANQVQSVTID